MNLTKSDLSLSLVLLTTLVIPLLLGLLLQEYTAWRWVSLPLHATIEAIGGTFALIIALGIFLSNHPKYEFTFLHRSAFAFLMMGVFDLFHALQSPGEWFVWLHTLAIFMGGIFLSFVWLPAAKVSKRTYWLTPTLIFGFAVLLSLGSIGFPDWVPQMLDANGEFTHAANLMNIIGGALFVLASLFFVNRCLQEPTRIHLIFVGHSMLFGAAGILFFFSTIWDLTWWFWHLLRLSAYLILFFFMVQWFIQTRGKFVQANQQFLQQSVQLENANTMLAEYRSAIDKSGLVASYDRQGNVKRVNSALLELSGYDLEAVVGKPHTLFFPSKTPPSVFQQMWQQLENKQVFKQLLEQRKQDGSSFYVTLTIIPILNSSGDIYEYLALREDVTEMVNSERALQTQFYTDPLTSIHNRFKLHEDLKALDHPHVALINIDQFKGLNDFYGTEFGDQVIQSLADHLVAFFQAGHYSVYRNHGDEFAVVTKEFVKFRVFYEQLQSAVSKIENTPIKSQQTELTLQLSVGVVESSHHLYKADIALKEAKQGKRTIVQYQKNLQVEELFKKNIYWSQQIKHALIEDRIKVAFQPIQNNETHKIEKYEALVRIVDAYGEMIPPGEFLEVAKHSRLYTQITRRVVQKAFASLKQGISEVSINICADDIFDDQTRSFLLHTLEGCDSSNRVTFELVESEGIEGFEQVQDFIGKVKSHGAKIAIDDFGTGYSNFDYLIQLQADYIKIDGSLIQDIDSNQSRYSLVQTIVAFANSNQLPVVAEFVANETLQASVQSLGIDYSQGYFIGRPQFLDQLFSEVES